MAENTHSQIRARGSQFLACIGEDRQKNVSDSSSFFSFFPLCSSPFLEGTTCRLSAWVLTRDCLSSCVLRVRVRVMRRFPMWEVWIGFSRPLLDLPILSSKWSWRRHCILACPWPLGSSRIFIWSNYLFCFVFLLIFFSLNTVHDSNSYSRFRIDNGAFVPHSDEYTSDLLPRIYVAVNRLALNLLKVGFSFCVPRRMKELGPGWVPLLTYFVLPRDSTVLREMKEVKVV